MHTGRAPSTPTANLIFTRRSNDLIFQTAAIKLFLPKAQRRYADFSYQLFMRTAPCSTAASARLARPPGAAHTRATRTSTSARTGIGTPQTGLRTAGRRPTFASGAAPSRACRWPFRPTYCVAPPHDATQAHGQRPPMRALHGQGRPCSAPLDYARRLLTRALLRHSDRDGGRI